MRARGVFGALLAASTVLIVLWLLLAGYGALLECQPDDSALRLVAWPAGPTLVGVAWSVLLLATVATALIGPRSGRVAPLAVATAAALLLGAVVPTWFASVCSTGGVSTSEFMDAFFLMLGGALPGGQATLGLRVTVGVLALLTVWAALGDRLPDRRGE